MTTVLLFKLLLAPSLIAVVTLAGRRWGPEVGGWLAGLPITGGPILLFLALEQGTAYAHRSAIASLIGLGAFTAFTVALAWSGRRVPWWAALAIGYAAYFSAGWPFTRLHCGAWTATAIGAAVLAFGAFALPRGGVTRRPSPPPAWELAARMIATAVVVIAVTGLAAWLGPGWTGVLTVFPTAATVLGGFALRQDGPVMAARVLRGLHLGMLGGLPGFFGVIAATVEPLGIGQSFGLGLAAAFVGQAILLLVLRFARRRQPEPVAPRHSQADSSSSTV